MEEISEILYIPSNIFDESEDLAKLIGKSDFGVTTGDAIVIKRKESMLTTIETENYASNSPFTPFLQCDSDSDSLGEIGINPYKDSANPKITNESNRKKKNDIPVLLMSESKKCKLLNSLVQSKTEMEIKMIGGKLQFMLLGSIEAASFPVHYISCGMVNRTGVCKQKVNSLQKVNNIQKVSIADQLKLKMMCICGNSGLKIWICPLEDCREAFYRYSLGRLHALIHLGYKPYKCSYSGCDWAFYNLGKLQRHEDTHRKKKDFVCTEKGCDKRFTTIYNLKCHKRSHEKPATFPCLINDCDETFQTAKDRDVHLKIHGESGALHVCPEPGCNKRFFMAHALSTHARIHVHKKDPLCCQYPNCGKVFEQPCRLKQHHLKHTGQRPFSCTFGTCKWAFRTSSKLKRHLSTHTNDRKFRCTIGNCDKSFLRSEHLKEHTLTHIGQKIHQNDDSSTSNSMVKTTSSCNKRKSSVRQNIECGDLPTQDLLLRQAIQSLETSSSSSDVLESCIFDIEPPVCFLENEHFSTVNLRDLD